MIILAQKIPGEQGSFDNWTFSGGGDDIAFSNIYGRGGFNPLHDVARDGGIRVTTGTNP
jgi:hypothetical protein